jgi:two-component system, OmpR family, phosphate regulon response regulator PhoB
MKKILIVDDRVEVQDLLAATFKRQDYQVLTAGSGQEAIDAAIQHKPDLVVMDLIMPGDLDGMEATRVLKGDPRTSSCKVMIVTGKRGTLALEEAAEAGADAFFFKPFSPLELLRKVEEILD